MEQASNDNIASALIHVRMSGNSKKEPAVSFGEAAGITQSMDNATKIEGIGAVAIETELIEEAKSFVDIVVKSAEFVDFPSPVGYVCNSVLINFEFPALLFFFCFFEMVGGVEDAREWGTGKRSNAATGYGRRC